MTPLEVKRRLSQAIVLSNETETICQVLVNGLGRFRVDGQYVLLIREDGCYRRITRRSLDGEI